MTAKEGISTGRWLPTRRTLGVVFVALAMVLAGCGSGGGDGGGGEGAATGTTAGGTTAGGETTAAGGAETTTAGSGGTSTAMANESMSNASMDNGTMANGSMANGSMGMANGSTSASLRIAHLSPDAPAVDVYLDNQSAVSGVAFDDVTDYMTVPTGEHVVTITAADNRSAVVFNDTVGLEDAAYTVAATGEISENATEPFAPLILEDRTNPPVEAAAVRLAHVSPDAGPVDVTVGEGNDTTVLFDNATFGNATEYVEVPGGEYTLDVRAATANNSGEVVESFDLEVDNGTSYTAFAAGYAAPDEAPADEPLDLIATTDGRTATLRVAHMSPDAPAVDVYLDNETAVSGAEFGDVTDFIETTPGERVVTITAADNRSAVVFNSTVPFSAGAYTVMATGEVGQNASQPFAPLVLSDNTTAPGENASNVRLVHAVPDAPPVDVTVEDNNTTLFDNVTFGNTSSYATVPAGEYTLEVRAATPDDNGTIVTTVDVDLDNETTYTAFAAGYVSPEDAPVDEPFDLIVAADSEQTGTGSGESESESGSIAVAGPSDVTARTLAAN